jgi:predicted Zn-dependent protease with MMP-like domain
MSAKYNREKKDSLLGETVVEFREVNDAAEETGFKIIGSPRGVELSGSSSVFTSNSDLQLFAKAVSDAWREHEKLRPKIIASIAGH